MKALKTARAQRGISQRALAKLAGISYKTIQLLEEGTHDPKISTLAHIAEALGHSAGCVTKHIASLFSEPPDSVTSVSERILEEGDASWKIWLFNFVDAFRTAKDKERTVKNPPHPETPQRIQALLASTTEFLCTEANIPYPSWTNGVPPLPEPWFPAEVENLKATALVESSTFFRERNIFVLGNFLERA